MNRELAMKVADAVLYEGYMLYPYRRSALKNRQRWAFGTLYPPDYDEVRKGTERSSMHSECLLNSTDGGKVEVELRFLQVVTRRIGERADDRDSFDSDDEGIERSSKFQLVPQAGLTERFEFSFPEGDGGAPENSKDLDEVHLVRGAISISSKELAPKLLKLSIDVANETFLGPDDRDRHSVLMRSFLLAHLILAADGGEFVSLLDPPDELRDHVSGCRNVGNFPVLLGTQGEHEMMLCSPIILYDYPQIAPESAGDFFDAIEIDEMLTLRVTTLSDDEKNEIRMGDERIRKLLERTERNAHEQLLKTHGVIRSLRPSEQKQR